MQISTSENPCEITAPQHAPMQFGNHSSGEMPNYLGNCCSLHVALEVLTTGPWSFPRTAWRSSAMDHELCFRGFRYLFVNYFVNEELSLPLK